MKKLLLAGILAAGLATSTAAYDTKAITGLNSTDGYETLTYHNVGLGSTKLVLGVEAATTISGDNKRGLALAGVTGLSFDTELPLLGDFDLLTYFGKGATSEFWIGQSLEVRKHFLYKLTDKLELGLSATVLSLDISNQVLYIHPVITPVVSMTVKI